MRLASPIAFCLALLASSACGDRASSGSPDANADGAASTEPDAATDAASDALTGHAEAAAQDAGLLDATSPPDATTDSGAQTSTGDGALTDADAATNPPSGDGSAPSSTAATAYLGNPAHTSSVVDPSLAPPLAAIWSFQPSFGLSMSYPLIAGGRAYFAYGANGAGSTQQLTAVDEHTGRTIWGPVGLGTLYLAGQAYDGERVFTADSSGVVRAFDAATGAPSWTHAPDASSLGSGPPTAYKGLVYTVGSGFVTALDEGTGHVRWTMPVDGTPTPETSPAVTDDGVFVSAGCQDLYAFDPLSGSLLWHHLPGGCSGGGATPIVFGGRVYVPEGQTDIFDAQSGGLLASLPCFDYPAFDNGRAYCNQRTPLQAFDLTTGVQAWAFSGDKQLNLLPFAAGGTVYVASDTGMMFGVDESSGSLTWSSEADSLGVSGLTVAGEGILLTQLYGGGGVVAYAHVEQPDAGVVLGDGAALTPLPVVPSGHPISLAVDATNVYWADFSAGQVNEAPKGGGTPVPLWTSTATPPVALAVDATNVYFIARGTGQGSSSSILSVPIARGSATPLASSPSVLSGPIVVGPSQVYWIDGTVRSVSKTGAGGVTTVVPGASPSDFTLDATNLYWSAVDGIHAHPLTGGAADRLIGVPPDPEPTLSARWASGPIAVDATNVYYALNTEAGPASIGSMPIAGGPVTVLASGRIGRIAAIALDDQNVYWAEGSGTIGQGAIAAVPKTGGRVAVLVSGLPNPLTLALDPSTLYFSNVASGIGKILK
jgi:outer membrane protein assembly factor BamB